MIFKLYHVRRTHADIWTLCAYMVFYRTHTLAQPAIFCTDTACIPSQILMQKALTSIIESLGCIPINADWTNVQANVTSCLWDNFSLKSPNLQCTSKARLLKLLQTLKIAQTAPTSTKLPLYKV